MPETHRLVLTGQCLIKRDVLSDKSPGYAEVKRLIASADDAFTNFEGSIVGEHGGAPTKTQYFSAVPPTVLDSLKDAGFNLLSLSNNHALDYGPGGVLSTVAEVERRGFVHAGGGRDLEEATRVALSSTGGKTIALIAMDCGPQPDHVYALPDSPAGAGAPGINPMRLDGDGVSLVPRETDRARILAAIGSARERADLVLVYSHSHHWSDVMWETHPAMRRLSQTWVDAGADVVVGHGTPAFQGIEVYRGKRALRRPGRASLVEHAGHESAVAVRPGTARRRTGSRTHRPVWRSRASGPRLPEGRPAAGAAPARG